MIATVGMQMRHDLGFIVCKEKDYTDRLLTLFFLGFGKIKALKQKEGERNRGYLYYFSKYFMSLINLFSIH